MRRGFQQREKDTQCDGGKKKKAQIHWEVAQGNLAP